MESQQKKLKPKYSIWQNILYMLETARQSRASGVIALCVLPGIFRILSSLTEMLVSPLLLRCVERRVPVKELLWTVFGFAVMRMVWGGLIAYLDINKQPARITVRMYMTKNIVAKKCTTSYPNIENQNIMKMEKGAFQAVNGNKTAGEAIWETFSDIIKNVGGFFIYLLMLRAVDPVIILVTAATAAAGYWANLYTKNWRYRHREEIAGYELKTWYVIDKARDVRLAKDLRIFGMEDWLKDVYESAMNLYRGYFSRRERLCLKADIFNALLAFLRNGIAYFYLISMTLKKDLPVSEFLLYFSAVGGFTTWIRGILEAFGKLYDQSLDISVMREYLETPEPFLFGDQQARKKWEQSFQEKEELLPCGFEFRDVSFRYPQAKEDTIKQLNLTIRSGEKLAVVGLNGAGKTTLVKLLCGLYDPTEGEVLLNGRDIREYNRDDYYALFSAVFQSFSVLETTLAENVAQTDEGIDMERVKDCIAKAGLTGRVESFPNGYDTHIGKWGVFEDGVELSGGELQRLMLARALYKNAPVIVLDEPTAALDPLAENDVYQKYFEMTGGKTSVYISHRLASTRFCDRIIYLKKGRIAEIGTHEELIRAQGEYAGIFKVQSKYYREDEPDETEK